MAFGSELTLRGPHDNRESTLWPQSLDPGGDKGEAYGLLKSDRFGAIFGIGGFGDFCSDIGFRLEAIRWC